ncbi:hypothetical protein [Chitinophaga pinensis]|uniref:Uncharacterized protein n=1 Tax=Chitinophaga pinensis (strain ATCC 43595 / DSM 2588 / LMG 13176 / NBRC 15968 / NCIMB 11800 / UQM 2034) TaxID=485918 RepID=A0A979G593_CHIPD|nr:hypothetical protein [Chitinophaga pinensis]ACU60968.1 hypothetical protein Cpin_3504 [Chitinophaga pinensis DSM 2588]
MDQEKAEQLLIVENSIAIIETKKKLSVDDREALYRNLLTLKEKIKHSSVSEGWQAILDFFAAVFKMFP